MAGIELPLWLVLLPGQLRMQLLEFFAVLSFLRLQFFDALPLLIVHEPRPEVPELAVYLFHSCVQSLYLGRQVTGLLRHWRFTNALRSGACAFGQLPFVALLVRFVLLISGCRM